MSDIRAPEGQIFVCHACGKTSPTLYDIDGAADRGWDESCMMNAILCYAEGLERGDDGRVTKAKAVEVSE